MEHKKIILRAMISVFVVMFFIGHAPTAHAAVTCQSVVPTVLDNNSGSIKVSGVASSNIDGATVIVRIWDDNNATKVSNNDSVSPVTVSYNRTYTVGGPWHAYMEATDNNWATRCTRTSATTFSITPAAYTVTGITSTTGGTISPATQNIIVGMTTTLTAVPSFLNFISTISGCGGAALGPNYSTSGVTYTTGQITGNCAVSATFATTTVSITPASLSIPSDPDTAVNFHYTATTNTSPAIGTECRLLDYQGDPLTSYQANEPLVATAPVISGDYSYYIFCRNTSYTAATAISPQITVHVNPSCVNGWSTPTTSDYDGIIGSAVFWCNATGYGQCRPAPDGQPYGHLSSTNGNTSQCCYTANFASTGFERNCLLTYNVTTNAGANGTISPTSQSVVSGKQAVFTIAPNSNYIASSVASPDCPGTLSGNTYTTGPVTANCTVNATFANACVNGWGTLDNFWDGSPGGAPGACTNAGLSLCRDDAGVVGPGNDYGHYPATNGSISSCCYPADNYAFRRDCSVTYTVTGNAGSGGTISPITQSVVSGKTTTLVIAPDYDSTVNPPSSNCGGSYSSSTHTYTTGPITADCTVSVSFTKACIGGWGDLGGDGTTSFWDGPSGGAPAACANAHLGYCRNDAGSTVGGGQTGGHYPSTNGSVSTCCYAADNYAYMRECSPSTYYTVTGKTGAGGTISPAIQSVFSGKTASLIVSPETSYIPTINSDCGGTLSGNTYTTGPVNGNCSVTATFTPVTVTINASPLTYTKNPNEVFGFTYTSSTTNVGGSTECRLLDYQHLPIMHYQSNSPINYTASGTPGDYAYYIECRDTAYTGTTQESSPITVHVVDSSTSLGSVTCSITIGQDGAGNVTITGKVRETKPGTDPSYTTASISDDHGVGSAYDAGDLTATAPYTQHFDNGSYTAHLDGTGMANPGAWSSSCTLDKSFIVAVVSPPPSIVNITVTKDVSWGGLIKDSKGNTCDAKTNPCISSVNPGDSLTLTAIPSSPLWVFDHWESLDDSCSGELPTCTLGPINTNKTVTAKFALRKALQYIEY